MLPNEVCNSLYRRSGRALLIESHKGCTIPVARWSVALSPAAFIFSTR
jgi:hypothetical protein